ncbi:hypothetical protein X986_2076 [Burkholderia pseudomallei]|nr:hypothetical protein [Burkholderia pseudomallei]KGX22588.1 hypothetical protein X984_96 [Burkholderia pseudomallei]KGX28787.1 hypothetical protein X986_2076 [Burkholderia pseudomallei]
MTRIDVHTSVAARKRTTTVIADTVPRSRGLPGGEREQRAIVMNE